MSGSMGEQPQWQPLSMLPVIAELVDGMLEDALEQRASLSEGLAKPWVLDDAIIDRVIKLRTEQLEDHWVYEEQYARWKRGSLTAAQAAEVERLSGQSAKLKATNEEILAIAEKISHSTIDKILEMDDLELGLRALAGLEPSVRRKD